MDSNIRKYFKRISDKYSTFFRGMGSLTLFPDTTSSRPYWMKERLTTEQQDALAIRGDWEAVGKDLESAIGYLKGPLAKKR